MAVTMRLVTMPYRWYWCLRPWTSLADSMAPGGFAAEVPGLGHRLAVQVIILVAVSPIDYRSDSVAKYPLGQRSQSVTAMLTLTLGGPYTVDRVS